MNQLTSSGHKETEKVAEPPLNVNYSSPPTNLNRINLEFSEFNQTKNSGLNMNQSVKSVPQSVSSLRRTTKTNSQSQE
jgi:hypothetical protein